MKNKKINIFAAIDLMLICGTITYYKLLWDLGVLALLFLSSVCCGDLIYRREKNIVVKMAAGLGCIGIVINLFLVLGINTNGWMCLVLFLLIIAGWKKFVENAKSFCGKISLELPWWSILLVIGFLFLLIMGGAPIDAREGDALSKHLPVTVYAAMDGKWYRNLTEGIVYGESMLLTYTYWTLFYSMRAYKAMTLFNTALFIFTFLLACKIMENIYPKSNKLLLGIIYFSAPLFYDLGTMMGTDMTSVFYFTAAFVIVSAMDREKIWKNTYRIAYLCACALFSKLTVINGIILIVGLVILFDVSYSVKQNNIRNLILKMIFSGLLWCIILFPNIFINWTELGNPFLPAYNGIFRSQYYALENFHDIYDHAPFSFSFETLWNLVFHTQRNRVEGLGRDLGLFPFGVFLIPAAVLVNRKKKFIITCSLPFISMMIGCGFTYNLRYLSSVFLLFMIVIVASGSVVIDQVNNSILKRGICTVLSVVLFSFNVHTFSAIGSYIKQGFKFNKNIADFFMENILNEIPKGKKALMVDGIAFKSDYNGYFVSNNWYITYILEKIHAGELSWEEYMNCFDYVLDSKEFANSDSEIENIIKDAGNAGALLEPYAADGSIVCYKVNHSHANPKRVVLDKADMNTERINENIRNLEDSDAHFIVEWETGSLTEDGVIEVRMEWLDSENNLIDCERQYHSVYTGAKQYESFVFDRVADSEHVNLIIETSALGQNNNCVFQKVKVLSYSDFIMEESKKFAYE